MIFAYIFETKKYSPWEDQTRLNLLEQNMNWKLNNINEVNILIDLLCFIFLTFIFHHGKFYFYRSIAICICYFQF